ncbi:MAG TPA: ribonuclease HIII, partial [Bacillota bacterium]|nr:ribonuclease HIII [Bacillota bacterium]
YNSKKVLFQGKNAYNEYALWSKHFGLDVVEPVETSTYVNGYRDKKVIGSDEVGTGDLFGPIVVCAAYVTPKDDAFLDELGVRDSKTLSDKQIKDIGMALVSQIPYHIVVLNNEKFNEMTEKGYNMNKIKAYLHNHAIKKMVSQVKNFDVVILDEFCSKANYFDYLKSEQAYTEIAFHTKAESVHRAVAAASIIARYKFILEMERISKEIGITLPKGSGAPADAIAKVIYLQQGPEIFRRIAKLNFKNFERIIKK